MEISANLKSFSKTYLAISISTLLVSPTAFAITHSDTDTNLLSGAVITLDSSDSENRLDGSGELRPTEPSNNVIHITGTPDTATNIYGATCLDNQRCELNNNVIIMDAGSVDNLIGASADVPLSASAEAFTDATAPVINDKTISADVTGSVNMYGGTVSNNIYGAYVVDTSRISAETYASADATMNVVGIIKGQGTVNLYGGTVTGNLYGASVITEGSVYAYVYSGSTAAASATATITADAIGTVNMSQGQVTGSIYGASVDVDANATATVTDTATGVATSTTNITANANGTVNLTGGTVTGSIYGASAQVAAFTGSYTDATVVVNVSAHSTVNIEGDVKLQSDDGSYHAELWGGYLSAFNDDMSTLYYNVFTDNTLNMSSSPLTVTKLGNFEYYQFAINDYNKSVINDSSSALITVTDELSNRNTYQPSDTSPTTNVSYTKLTGISGTTNINVGDTINLITVNGGVVTQGDDTTSLNDFFDLTNSDNKVKVGLVREADISYSIKDDSVVATIDKITEIIKEKVDDNIKPLAEGRLATLMNVTRGADALSHLSLKHVDAGTFTPIAAIDGGINQYDSGSSIDSNDYRIMVGSRYQILDNLYAGIAIEYGRSHYDTYNDFASGSVHGRGHTYNYGASLFSKYSQFNAENEFYIDGAFRFGQAKTAFLSHDIITGAGSAASYDSKVGYIGVNLGSGYIYQLNNRYSFDSSLRYFYSRLSSDSVVIDGDNIHFQTLTSSRVQLKEQFNYQSSARLIFTLAGIYEYEFNSKANANVAGMAINAPSVKGSTGIFELGIKAKPIENETNFGLNVILRGYSGKRDGVNAFVMMKYDF